MLGVDPKPWDYQPGIDSHDSYASFLVYLDLAERHIPRARRLRMVSHVTHVTMSTIQRWARSDLWEARSTERMQRLFNVKELAITDELAKEGKHVAQEWLETIRMQKAVVDDQIEKLATQCLDGQGSTLRVADLIKLSKETLHSERLLRGQATEIVADELDLSRLTDDQLAEYERLTSMARREVQED